MGAPFPLVPLMLVLLLIAAAVVSLWLGLRPRRRGTAPHCRRCDYNLTGATGARCTECGADLSAKRAVVHGERRRREWAIALGCVVALACLAAATVLSVRSLGGVDPYRYLPLWWVVGDLEQGQPGQRMRAVVELERRFISGAIRKEDCASFLEPLLAEQAGPATPGFTQRAVDLLGAIIAAKYATEEQTERFLTSLVRVELRLRKHVQAGRAAPYELKATAACPATGFEAVVTTGEVAVDGRESAAMTSGTAILNGNHTAVWRSGAVVVPTQPGRYEAACDVKVEIYPTGAASVVGIGARPEKPMRVYETTLRAAVEVVEREPEDAYRTVSDPEMDGKMRGLLSLDRVRLERGTADDPLRLTARLNAETKLPAAVASELVAEFDDGRRVAIGQVKLFGLSHPNQLSLGASCPPPAPKRAKVRLVPSREAAAMSIDVVPYWGGTIDFGEFDLSIEIGNK